MCPYGSVSHIDSPYAYSHELESFKEKYKKEKLIASSASILGCLLSIFSLLALRFISINEDYRLIIDIIIIAFPFLFNNMVFAIIWVYKVVYYWLMKKIYGEWPDNVKNQQEIQPLTDKNSDP